MEPSEYSKLSQHHFALLGEQYRKKLIIQDKQQLSPIKKRTRRNRESIARTKSTIELRNDHCNNTLKTGVAPNSPRLELMSSVCQSRMIRILKIKF